MSQKRLKFVEKEKQDLDRQLNFENKKIKMLESGIQELKKIILTLQVLLISHNRETRGLSKKLAGSKDCSELKKELIFRSIPSEKENIFATKAEIENCARIYFPELKSLSSLPEKEFSAALEKFSLYTLNQICDLENNMLSKLENCKFLCSYQLVDHVQLNKMWKIFLVLRKELQHIQLLKKFMLCFCNILKSSLVAHILHSVNKIELVKVFPKNFNFTLRDFLCLCNNAFNKILYSISQTFENQSSLVNQHSDFFKNCSNIESNTPHLPVFQGISFRLYKYRFEKIQWDLQPKQVPSKNLNIVFSARKQNVMKALNTLNAPEVPFFLNFTMSLTENIVKELYHSSNENFTVSANFSMTAFQMKNYLSLLNASSPMFHILSKYCVDILNLENLAVHDICYWKNHWNILGIDKCDVHKMIALLEHMDKHRKCKNDKAITLPVNLQLKENLTTIKSEESLKVEKEKQRLLNAAIEEIERDLGETFLQKEKFKNMALDVSKMLLHLKKYDGEILAFSNIQLDEGEISSETCFCENCIMDEDASEIPSHDTLQLCQCFKWIGTLICTGRRLEGEMCELQKSETELKTLYNTLKDKNSELEMNNDKCNMNLENANKQIQNLTYDLQKQKEEYEHLSNAVNEKDTLNMLLEAKISQHLSLIDDYKLKLKAWEDKVSSLSINKEKLELSLLSKDEEIASLKASFEENENLLKETQMRCEEYRNNIQLLNSRISRFEEEKMIDLSQNVSRSLENSFVTNSTVKSSKTIINELQAKIDSLTKYNDSLNLTIENIEEDLKNVFMEKQSALEEVGKLSNQITCLTQEISNTTQRYNDEKESNEILLLKLKEYEKLVLDNKDTINQLETEIETLQKNATVMKTVIEGHEELISNNKLDIKRYNQSIEQLEKQIKERNEENCHLKIQVKSVQKQERLKYQVNELMSQKSELEEEIKRLRLIETEKEQILENLAEANLQRNSIAEQFHQLNLELETEKKKNGDLELECNELHSSLKDSINSNTSLEKELNKNKNLISNLNRQLDESSTELKNLKNINCELTTEISSFKSIEKQLTQEISNLSKSLQAESTKNQLLMGEVEDLKIKDSAHEDVNTELQKLKNIFNGASKFIAKILNIILCAVQNYPESADFEELKLSLMSLRVHWKQDSEKELQTNVFDLLSSFFGTLIKNHKDDLHVCELISTIKDSVKTFSTASDPGQKVDASLVISPDAVSNTSVFESTFVTQRNSQSRDVLADLKYIKAQTNEIFCNFNHILSKKSEEIEKYKKELKQLPLTSAKIGSKPSETDKNSFKWKYELIKRQYRQLEERYNKIVISSDQMQESFKLLEEKNKQLEEEADDLCRDLKNMEAYYSSSDELLDALTELNALRHKLKELENENCSLKKGIQEFQLQRMSVEKPSPPCIQKRTQIPKLDRLSLKENSPR